MTLTNTRCLRMLGLTPIIFVMLAAACGFEPPTRVIETSRPATIELEPVVLPPTIISREAPAANSYLEATVEPCVPARGSRLDPCERRFDDWDRTFTPYISSAPRPMVSPPTMEGSISYLLDRGVVPHLVIRGTFVPNSTRCVEQSDALYGGTNGIVGEAGVRHYIHDRCFGDVRVNEYLIGNGPSHLTIDLGHHHKILDLTGQEYYDWLLDMHTIFEERELIVWLMLPVSYNFAAWKMLVYPLDVQRKSDGTVVVVEWLARRQPHLQREENGFEVELDVYRETIKRVYSEHARSTGGKMTLRQDSPDLIRDANTEFIRSHMMRSEVFNIIDATPAAPPPIPGEDDLYTAP